MCYAAWRHNATRPNNWTLGNHELQINTTKLILSGVCDSDRELANTAAEGLEVKTEMAPSCPPHTLSSSGHVGTLTVSFLLWRLHFKVSVALQYRDESWLILCLAHFLLTSNSLSRCFLDDGSSSVAIPRLYLLGQYLLYVNPCLNHIAFYLTLPTFF